jgi:hypothetical protein
MKKMLLKLVSLLLLGSSLSLQSQVPFVKQIITANSGKFEFAPPFTDFVTIQTNNPVSGAGTTIQTIGTQSAQDICKNGTTAYIAAQDSLVMINLDNYQRLGAVADSGLNKLLLFGNKLLISKQYPITSHFVEVRNATDLSLVTSIGGIPGDCGGMTIIGDSLYVAVNGGWMGMEGKIAVIETTGWTLARIINLGPQAVGIMSLYAFQGKVISVNKSPFSTPDAGSISVYDPATGAFTNFTFNKNVATGTGISGNLLYFIYNYGIGSFNLNTLQIADSVVVPDPGSAMFRYITSSLIDTLNNRIYVNVGDYFTPGICQIHAMNGDSISSWVNGISSDALLVDYRVSGLGISEENKNRCDMIRLFPNPASDQLSVTIDKESVIREIQIHDITGKVIVSKKPGNQSNQCTLAVQGLPAGLYMVLTTTTGGKTFYGKLVKN